MMKWLIGALAVLGLSAVGVFGASDFTDFTTEDVFVPTQCDSVAKHGDHLLVEYSIAFANGTVASSQQAPMQLYYTLLDKSEEYPVMGALKGMCKNATRKITWEDPSKADFKPIFYSSQNPEDNGVSIELTLVHITEAEDYRIFDYIRTGNSSAALDMIEQHRGINAFDEWGQNALMMAVQLKKLDIVAALLNTRLPKVNVNTAKSSGFTALIYAVELSAPTILQALLRRGADPHAIVKQPGSYGNTALHYACLFERTKHAELLLEYGAQPEARNEHGQRPLDLVPRDAVRSTKLYFKRIFDEAIAKQAAAAVGSVSSPSDTRMGAGSEL